MTVFVHVNTPVASISGSTSSARTAYPQNTNQSGVRVYNAGAVGVFLKSGDVTVTATTTGGQFVGAGQTVIFTRDPKDTHLAAITASSTATVYFSSCTPVEP
jgi:hypothetical protein